MAKLYLNKAKQPKQKKEKEVKSILHCEDCAHATPDMKFENLSLEGKPTLLICPFDKWKKLFKEPACEENFKPKAKPEPTPQVVEVPKDKIETTINNNNKPAQSEQLAFF